MYVGFIKVSTSSWIIIHSKTCLINTCVFSTACCEENSIIQKSIRLVGSQFICREAKPERNFKETMNQMACRDKTLQVRESRERLNSY